jgi:hypothetical protein
MLAPATVDAVDGYWAGFLGVPRSRLRPPRPVTVPHAGLGDYRGMFAQMFGGAPVVSLPAELLERHGREVAEAAGSGLVDDDRWRAVFGARVDAVVGPAGIGYADAGTLRASPSGAAAFAFAARAALDAGLIAQHRALLSNTHSLGIARRLGFVPYAVSLAVRLRDT